MNKKERITVKIYKNHPTFKRTITWINEHSELTLYDLTDDDYWYLHPDMFGGSDEESHYCSQTSAKKNNGYLF